MIDIKKMLSNNIHIAIVDVSELLITDTQSALDLIATVRYETDCDCLVVPSSCLSADFFILSTGLAGEILQKFMNYGMKLAIVGDFSGYTSKSLRSFIYESNKSGSVFFVSSVDEAAIKLSASGGQ